MAVEGSRGTVGIVRPTQRTGGFEDLLRILPQGIRLIPLALDVQRGAIDEFETAIPAYEAKVAALATMGVDVINPSGAPPFMVLGYAKEQELIRRWGRYGLRVHQRCFQPQPIRRGGLHARAGLADSRYCRAAGNRPGRAGVPCGAGAMLGHPASSRHPRAGAWIRAPNRRNAALASR